MAFREPGLAVRKEKRIHAGNGELPREREVDRSISRQKRNGIALGFRRN
jgi:hypothetical protein